MDAMSEQNEVVVYQKKLDELEKANSYSNSDIVSLQGAVRAYSLRWTYMQSAGLVLCSSALGLASPLLGLAAGIGGLGGLWIRWWQKSRNKNVRFLLYSLPRDLVPEQFQREYDLMILSSGHTSPELEMTRRQSLAEWPELLAASGRREHVKKQQTESELLRRQQRAIEPVQTPQDRMESGLRTIKQWDNAKWDAVKKRYESVRQEWLNTEMDILALVKYPLFSDAGNRFVKDFRVNMTYARTVKPDNDEAYLHDHAFVKAVAEMEVAWNLLEAEAKRVGSSTLPDVERKRVEKAQQLLAIALGSGGNPHERQTAYQRAMKELDGVLSVPDRAMAQIEETFRREIEAKKDSTDVVKLPYE